MIVTYDEHSGFTFDRYGVRVPAVIISPFTTTGGVDATVYDHSSISKFMSTCFSTTTLTKRDAASATIAQNWGSARTDCPTQLPEVYTFPSAPVPHATPSAAHMAEPMNESGHTYGSLYILRKAELELSPPERRADIVSDVQQIKTKGDVENYHKKVKDMIAKARAARGM